MVSELRANGANDGTEAVHLDPGLFGFVANLVNRFACGMVQCVFDVRIDPFIHRALIVSGRAGQGFQPGFRFFVGLAEFFASAMFNFNDSIV